MFSAERPWHNIIWNNKDIRIDNKTIFYKTFFESGITHVTDFRFDLNITESHKIYYYQKDEKNKHFGMGRLQTCTTVLLNFKIQNK